MAKRGRPFKNPSVVTMTATINDPIIIESTAEFGNVSAISQSPEPLPAQPISRLRLLEVMKEQLRTPDGKAGITAIIVSKAYLNEMAEDVDDMTLQNAIFLHVKDGDERAIVRRFFSNLDE